MNNFPRKRAMDIDVDLQCADMILSIPRIKKIRLISQLSQFDDIIDLQSIDQGFPQISMGFNKDKNSRKRTMNFDIDSECVDMVEFTPRFKKMKTMSRLSDIDDTSEQVSIEEQSIDNCVNRLDKEEDRSFIILLRLPSGVRQIISIPSSSKIKDLFVYIEDYGYEMDKLEMVQCFPRRIFTMEMGESSMESCGIINRDTIYVQNRWR